MAYVLTLGIPHKYFGLLSNQLLFIQDTQIMLNLDPPVLDNDKGYYNIIFFVFYLFLFS